MERGCVTTGSGWKELTDCRRSPFGKVFTEALVSNPVPTETSRPTMSKVIDRRMPWNAVKHCELDDIDLNGPILILRVTRRFPID